MIDDRLRAAARQLHDSVGGDAPVLGKRRRSVAPLVVCAVLVVGAVWVLHAASHRSAPTSPAVSVVTEAPTTTPQAIIPVVPCFEQADQAMPPPPVGTIVDTTIPAGGYVTGAAELVCGDERTAIIEGLLADVPVPAGFEVPDYGTSGPAWRSLIYEVSSAVVCAWLDEWFIAQAADDRSGMTAAAGALDTVGNWDMLNRDFMAYHAEYVQKWVDAVNGRGLIGPGGEFDVPPTRDLAESALVCTWRHR